MAVTETLIRLFLLPSSANSAVCGMTIDNSALILLLPYPTAELRDNLENFEAYYDEIELCSAAAGIHPKGAIQIRNRQMVDRSDLVVFCVDHSSGGAYQTLRYAQRKKKILNLAHFEGCG